MDMGNVFKMGAAAIGSVVGFLYGEWSVMLQALLFFTAADYLTGIIASGVEGKLSSKIGAKGILKKVMVLLVVAVSHFADVLIGQAGTVMTAACFFYIANELLSILENAGRANVPVPGVLKKAIAIFNSKGGNEDGPRN